jgi:lactate permease
VVWAMAGFRGLLGVWPAALTAGMAFAVPQFLVSNFHGPWLVDIVASLSSVLATICLLRFWKPKQEWAHEDTSQTSVERAPSPIVTEEPSIAGNPIAVLPRQTATLAPSSSAIAEPVLDSAKIRAAWTPWLLLSLLVFIWGVPLIRTALDKLSAPSFQVAGLHNLVVRTSPVVPQPTPDKPTKPEEAIFKLNWLSATGTGILVAAIISGLIMRFSPAKLATTFWETLIRVRYSLVTIAAMLALGYVTKYSGTDATLGLALAKTGTLYPFFGAMLGWLGVALTGSDTASNVLFGSLQKITAQQIGISPVLMAAANSSGGVMGKMVDAQSIVVASTATNWYGHESSILRYVFFHSFALAVLVGILVFLQAYVFPFTRLVVP